MVSVRGGFICFRRCACPRLVAERTAIRRVSLDISGRLHANCAATGLCAKPHGCTLKSSTTGDRLHVYQSYRAEQYPAIRHLEARRIAVDLLLGAMIKIHLFAPKTSLWGMICIGLISECFASSQFALYRTETWWKSDAEVLYARTNSEELRIEELCLATSGFAFTFPDGSFPEHGDADLASLRVSRSVGFIINEAQTEATKHEYVVIEVVHLVWEDSGSDRTIKSELVIEFQDDMPVDILKVYEFELPGERNSNNKASRILSLEPQAGESCPTPGAERRATG